MRLTKLLLHSLLPLSLLVPAIGCSTSLDQQGVDACSQRCQNISGNGGPLCGNFSATKADCGSVCSSGVDTSCPSQWDNWQICENTSNPAPTTCAASVANFANCEAQYTAYEACHSPSTPQSDCPTGPAFGGPVSELPSGPCSTDGLTCSYDASPCVPFASGNQGLVNAYTCTCSGNAWMCEVSLPGGGVCPYADGSLGDSSTDDAAACKTLPDGGQMCEP
jgi:hypothetical protein